MLFESCYLFDNFEHEAVGFFHLLQVGIFAGRVDVMLTGKYAYAAVKAFGGKHQGRGASTLVGKCDVFADFSSGGFYKSLCLRMQCVCYILILDVVVDYINLYIGKLAFNIGIAPASIRSHSSPSDLLK